MNYYDLLGLTPDASYEDVRAAYLELSKKYHPDVNSARNANYLFIELKQAYDTLSNPVHRGEYNNRIKYGRNSFYSNERHYSKSSNSNTSADTSNENKSATATKNTSTKTIEIFMIMVLLIFVGIQLNGVPDQKNPAIASDQTIKSDDLIDDIVDNDSMLDYNILAEEAIKIIENYYIVNDIYESSPKTLVDNNPEVVVVYGWNAYFVENDIWFVAYEFDFDEDYYNGYNLYSYEVDLEARSMKKISGNRILEEKYRNLELIN